MSNIIRTFLAASLLLHAVSAVSGSASLGALQAARSVSPGLSCIAKHYIAGAAIVGGAILVGYGIRKMRSYWVQRALVRKIEAERKRKEQERERKNFARNFQEIKAEKPVFKMPASPQNFSSFYAGHNERIEQERAALAAEQAQMEWKQYQRPLEELENNVDGISVGYSALREVIKCTRGLLRQVREPDEYGISPAQAQACCVFKHKAAVLDSMTKKLPDYGSVEQGFFELKKEIGRFKSNLCARYQKRAQEAAVQLESDAERQENDQQQKLQLKALEHKMNVLKQKIQNCRPAFRELYRDALKRPDCECHYCMAQMLS